MAKGKFEYWLTEDGLTLLRAWKRNGETDEAIASKCGIVPSTFYEWKKRHGEIAEALTRGREIVDTEVENAVLKRARGYRYTEVTRELKTNPATGESEMMITKSVVKEVAPDVAAQKFWLTNRGRGTWKSDPKEETDASKEAVEVAMTGDVKECME